MKIILASQSPRRRELLAQLGLSFEVIVHSIDETFPSQSNPIDAVRYIAEKKAEVFKGAIADELVIAADTVVTIDGQILGKPLDRAEAVATLIRLSGRKHEVITAVALLHKGITHTFHEVTAVHFGVLSEQEITHYVDRYQPYDKAGSYGIQEWIGTVAVEKIEGSYTNVVGLPTQQLYHVLKTSFPNAL